MPDKPASSERRQSLTSAGDNVWPSCAWFMYLLSSLDEPPEEIR